jgi:hypothetical protein
MNNNTSSTPNPGGVHQEGDSTEFIIRLPFDATQNPTQ